MLPIGLMKKRPEDQLQWRKLALNVKQPEIAVTMETTVPNQEPALPLHTIVLALTYCHLIRCMTD